ncbi:hypothetical protein A9F13_01g07854 [Clavispora lusitaniae]|uniref:Uncharacterized protein n=1 Tax=Clavispora lusitaniae TaxID=36911 RepID=A0AA91Q5T9_CLALS|nr:hypothetical protein A9F13_01g07854 [Clavispora lusitaniae]
MNTSDDCSLVTHSLQRLPSPTRSPLRSSPMRNLSPTRPKTNPGTPRNSTSPFRSSESPQRQYTDLMAKLTSISADYAHLEAELAKKSQLLKDLSQKLSASDQMVRVLQNESAKTHELHQREIASYKEQMDDMRRRNNLLARKLEQESHRSQSAYEELEDKYTKLIKSYKALQSNMELESNSRALLIDQIEYLTKERDFLLENSTSANVSASDESVVQYGYMSQNPDTSGSDSDGSVHGTHLLSAFVDEYGNSPVEASSPLKDVYDSENSMEVAEGFHFPPTEQLKPSSHSKPITSPPSPDPDVKSSKRQSLPAHFNSNSPKHEEEFVLSPLKLTSNVNLSYFEKDDSLPTPQPSSTTKKRYSSSKPHHNRYNSHDFVPIMVEFEQPDAQLRSASSPEKDVLSKLTSVQEHEHADDRDQAFMRLNGFDDNYSKRDSLITSSSKRSSLITDFNTSGNDITKQEIMTLKFELQSLKLHNEKLLSYIGFELQKQKKNIKKLSSKQNLQGSNIEYSDAKLIEKSRNMLIHKKRILRSVSINPILSTKYNSGGAGTIFSSGTGLGIFNANTPGADDDDEFDFKSEFINSLKADDCDDYGFLTHESKYNSRVLSRKNRDYLNEAEGTRVPKKYKSQTFRPSMDGEFEMDFADIDEISIDDIEEEAEGCAQEDEQELWETASSQSSSSSEIDYKKLNTFNQMRYLILGKEHFRKTTRRDESLVDENLKYKFLTIVVGIVIIGFRLTAQPPHHLTHN